MSVEGYAAAFPPGAVVRYRPDPNFTRGEEHGLVLRATPSGVFVRFSIGDAAKRCDPRQLRVIVLPLAGWDRAEEMTSVTDLELVAEARSWQTGLFGRNEPIVADLIRRMADRLEGTS